MVEVLILATAYDRETRITHGWAQDLDNRLHNTTHTCQLVSKLAVNGLQPFPTPQTPDAFVVFFGHGEYHRLLGQKGRFSQAPTIVDDTSVAILSGYNVYAVCCEALFILGQVYGNTFPNRAFVGYGVSFGFSRQHHQLFRDVVNQGAEDFINGVPATTVVSRLRSEWRALSARFLNRRHPQYIRSKNSFVAGVFAAINATHVGSAP